MPNHLEHTLAADDERLERVHINIEHSKSQHDMSTFLQEEAVKTCHDDRLLRSLVAFSIYKTQLIFFTLREMKCAFSIRLSNDNIVCRLHTTINTATKIAISTFIKGEITVQIYQDIPINLGFFFLNISIAIIVSPSQASCVNTESRAADEIQLDITIHDTGIRATYQSRTNIGIAFQAYIDIAFDITTLTTTENTQFSSADFPAGNHHFHGTLAPIHHLCTIEARPTAAGKDFTDSAAINKDMRGAVLIRGGTPFPLCGIV